jgi:microsomal dipeptidase-like Zn-dependent dipeptidase
MQKFLKVFTILTLIAAPLTAAQAALPIPRNPTIPGGGNPNPVPLPRPAVNPLDPTPNPVPVPRPIPIAVTIPPIKSSKSVRYDIPYTVDTTPGRAGVYYQKDRNGGFCDVGDDAGPEGTCIKLASERFSPQATYWLDTNPSWPGVYYKGNGTRCLEGGLVPESGNCIAASFDKTVFTSEIDASMWGFADLHTHPAAHLGFGSDDNGNDGIFYGKPGLGLNDGTIAADLAACASDVHSGFELDFVRHTTRAQIVDKLGTDNHLRSGYPMFLGWPQARSGFHQQMHITWIRRAYDGGLRLMVASAVDNQTFHSLWKRSMGITGLSIRPDADYQSARKQLAYIRKMAEANSSWMQIVTTSDQARQALRDNKLSVVLGLELDKLTVDQILALKNEFGATLVTPVHTIDNEVGGAAVYENLFNVNSHVLNGRYFSIEGDMSLEFRFGTPQRLAPDTVLGLAPKDDNDAYYAMGYGCSDSPAVRPCYPSPWGHKNVQGLNTSDPLRRLMANGMIIDLAHMSDKSQEQSIALAEQYNYPVLNSHSNLRVDGMRSSSERDMRTSLASRMTKLGGMLGFGTGGETAGAGIQDKQTILSIYDPKRSDKHSTTQFVRMTGEQKVWSLAIAPLEAPVAGESCSSLTFSVQTGGDDLRGGVDRASAKVQFKSFRPDVVLPLSNGAKWDNNSVHDVTVSLPALTPMNDLLGINLIHDGGTSNDAWAVDMLQVRCNTNTGSSKTLLRLSGAPLLKLTSEQRQIPVFRSSSGGNLRIFKMTVRTGGDDIRGGLEMATGEFGFRDNRNFSFPMSQGLVWGNDSTHTLMIRLPDAYSFANATTLRIRTNFNGDNWNIDGLALEGYQDPVKKFGDDLERLLAVMNGRGVALGSDLNGFANQIPMSEKTLTYPFTLPEELKPSGRDVTLGQMISGTRYYNFTQDGIAQIGMEPDLLAATAAVSGTRVVRPLFSSAYDFVQMWSKIEAATPGVP